MKIQMYGPPNELQNEISDNEAETQENYYYDELAEHHLPEHLTDDYEPDLWRHFLERYHGEEVPTSYLPYAGYAPYGNESSNPGPYESTNTDYLYPRAFGTDDEFNDRNSPDDNYYRSAAVQEHL